MHGQVRVGVGAALQRPHDQRSLRVVGGGRRAEAALVDERLDQGVIAGDLVQVAVAQQVGAGVADMADGDLGARPQQCGERGTHALDGRVGHAHVVQRVAGRGHGCCQGVQHVVTAREVLAVERRDSGDRHGAGYLAGRVAAHAVGDGQQPRTGVGTVLVALAEQADVRAERVMQCQGHLRSSRTVLPMRIGTPMGTGVGWVTFCRSRYVPLVEPRSSTSH